MASRVKERLKKLRSSAQFGDIELKNVKEALTDEAFHTAEGLLTANDNGSTLLHLAAQTKFTAVLPWVTEEYKRLQVFPDVILRLNNKGMSPLHVAIEASRYESVVLLFKECMELCPKAFEPNEQGWTLMHSAIQSPDNLNIVRFLLSHDVCKPMLLSLGRGGPRQLQQQNKSFLPLELVKMLLNRNEGYMKQAQKQSTRDDHSVKVGPKQKTVEKFKEILSLVEQQTTEMKIKEEKRLAEEQAQKEILKLAEKTRSDLCKLLYASNWVTLINEYWLSENDEVQKITVRFLGERHKIDGISDIQLPPLTGSILQVLTRCLRLPEEDATVKETLRLLNEFTCSKENNTFIMVQEELHIEAKVVHLLSSLDVETQQLCASILLNILNHRPESFEYPTEDSEMVQTLLLVKHFSQDEEAKSLASEVLELLGVKKKQPDPGYWTVRHVSFWMESNLDLDQREDFSKRFREADIDGLHLLELTSAEMTGLGVKYVSHQRKIASLIDGLRRMNMRASVGHKDVFLSYAHINIKFARRLKVILNGANYTVWIDEAGIRAGHKWRNEIADGIQGCNVFLFVMTPRSANSVYCQDEIALAEEYHKPIMTVRLEAVSEMDPGLKLIIQRRQWIDFVDELLFESNKMKLIEAISATMGPGSGPEPEETDKTQDKAQHTPDQPQKCLGSKVKSPSPLPEFKGAELMLRDYIEQEMEKVRSEVREEVRQLKAEVDQLRVTVEDLNRRLKHAHHNII